MGRPNTLLRMMMSELLHLMPSRKSDYNIEVIIRHVSAGFRSFVKHAVGHRLGGLLN